MKEQITSILDLAREYLTIKLEEEKARIANIKKQDDYINRFCRSILEPLKSYVEVNGIEKTANQICKLLGLNDIFEPSEKEQVEKEVNEERNKNPIPFLMSALNNDLILTISQKYGIISGEHPLKRIPSIYQFDNELINNTISFLILNNKEDIIKKFIEITCHDQAIDLFTVISYNLSKYGKLIASELFTLINNEIYTDRS